MESAACAQDRKCRKESLGCREGQSPPHNPSDLGRLHWGRLHCGHVWGVAGLDVLPGLADGFIFTVMTGVALGPSWGRVCTPPPGVMWAGGLASLAATSRGRMMAFSQARYER